MHFLKRYLRDCRRTDVETLRVGTVWWEADAATDATNKLGGRLIPLG